jgi:hypothetical protein
LISRRDLLRQAPIVATIWGLPAVACARTAANANLFVDIPAMSLPSSVTAIVTEGWSQKGVGSGRYVFDPRVDRAWVQRFPRSSAITVDGRGFRLDQVGGNVRQYGAVGDDRHDDTAAINEALSRGGTVVLPGPATYRVTGRLLMPVDTTRLQFEASVTLHTSAWQFRGSQIPFGNAIHVTGDDCEIAGAGPSSIIRNDRSDANGIGFLHCGGGRVSGLSLQGGKDRLSAITDDTFQSGISIVNDPASNRRGRISRTIIEDCTISEWMQYGINLYGALVRDVVLRRNTITLNGQTDDRESVGSGIAITRGVGPIEIGNNTIARNKGCGIFISSAGVQIERVVIVDNEIAYNGLEGICCSEERNFGAVAAIGVRELTISKNRIENNGATGVRAGTYDGVGSITGLSILDNRIANNRKSGLLLQANADPARGVDATVSGNQFIANSDYGIVVGLNRISLRHDGNRFDRNRRGDSVDHRSGTARRLIDR